MRAQPPTAFFAYPSEPTSIGEIFRTTISEINRNAVVLAKGWEDSKVGGKVVIDAICTEIENADIFCADLTGMNANVMFELGFAIAMNRRIWLALDQTLVDAKAHFEQLRVLTTIGYSKYCNSRELLAGFFKDEPYGDLENTIFEKSIRPSLGPATGEKLLYLKSRHETEASIQISNLIDALRTSDVKVIVDDPKESTVQSLTWYGVQVYTSTAVVCHLTGPARTGARLLNARYALVCGMALGMGKKLLMLSEGDFLAPIDYRDLMHHYVTAAEAKAHVREWLNEVERRREERGTPATYASQVRLATELKGLQIGEYIAENESDALVSEYFIETAAYNQALQQEGYSIFVGRKGSGKSANRFKLSAEIAKDKRNLVCVISPVAYDLEGVISLLRKYKERDAKGYAIESLWKFLFYTEIARSAANALRQRAAGTLNDDEANLLALTDEIHGKLRGDFTLRLQRTAEAMISTQADEGDPEKFRGAISEAIHQGVLKDLRMLLGKVLSGRKRICILVDNLDKAWDKQSDLGPLTEFLLGLLSAGARLPADFRHDDFYRQPVSVSLCLFLRSDIFERLLAAAREPDKIVHSKIAWRDKELLLRVIEQRFVASHEGQVPPWELWEKYFCNSIRGISVRNYLYDKTLPRPRDLVFLTKAAISIAVNRGQALVREQDILDAEKQYSQYAFESILVENGLYIASLEKILYEFAGCRSRVTEREIVERLIAADVPREDHQRVIDQLCALSFIGLQVKNGDTRFAEDSTEIKRNLAIAKQSLGGADGLIFNIHPAFWTFLEVIAH